MYTLTFVSMISLVIGTQWGDEGKGKIVDLLASRADYVVRFHGGNNAGHTVITTGKIYTFHLIPAGILHKKVVGVIGNGVVVDLEVLEQEIAMLKKNGIGLRNRLLISERSHLIMPYHKGVEEIYERARGKESLGTTRRGIGPVYADKVSYNGIRLFELLNWKNFVESFTFQAQVKNKMLKAFGIRQISIKNELERFKKLRKSVAPYVTDTFSVLQKAIENKKNILLEGAQGIMLDNDWSLYPYTTASNSVVGAVNIGTGIHPSSINKVFGVLKAYNTRVGGRPVPTEFNGKIADLLRKKGAEFGATTGRPRAIGWLDLEEVKFACKINKVTDLVITKADILSGLSEIRLCLGYQLNGKKVSYSSCGLSDVPRIKPVYKTFEGWKEDLNGKMKKFSDLPKSCQKYINFIEDFLGIPIKIVSTGPDRKSNIYK